MSNYLFVMVPNSFRDDMYDMIRAKLRAETKQLSLILDGQTEELTRGCDLSCKLIDLKFEIDHFLDVVKDSAKILNELKLKTEEP